MNIINYYYNEDTKLLYIEFTEKNSIKQTYRKIDLSYNDVKYYSPVIIDENDLHNIDKDFLIELLEEYFKHNDLPEEEIL